MSISDDDLTSAMEAWNLDSDGQKRTPYKRVKERKGESIPVTARCDSLMVRRTDEILASAVGWPTYKTRSDIIQDALAMWLEEWDKDHPDNTTPLSYQFKVEQMGRRRSARTDFLEMAKTELDGLREDGDITGLAMFIATLDIALIDFRHDAPASFLVKIDEIRNNAKRLIDASAPRSDG